MTNTMGLTVLDQARLRERLAQQAATAEHARAERLAARLQQIRDVHTKWSAMELEDLDPLRMWEALGNALKGHDA